MPGSDLPLRNREDLRLFSYEDWRAGAGQNVSAMIASLLCLIEQDIPRVTKDVWLSFVYDLATDLPERRPRFDLMIRLAGDEDIERIAAGTERDQPIVRSCLRFWREFGFRSLYLGFVGNGPEPSIFQYVMDERDNHRYEAMLYGRMYRSQSPETAQVENLYTFRHKRCRNLALEFELQLFRLLKGSGIKQVRTHIAVRNRAALLWATTVGFRPEQWITMVSIDLPLLREQRKQFAFSPLREHEHAVYPLALFRL